MYKYGKHGGRGVMVIFISGYLGLKAWQCGLLRILFVIGSDGQ
jgi:hypothetical protein